MKLTLALIIVASFAGSVSPEVLTFGEYDKAYSLCYYNKIFAGSISPENVEFKTVRLSDKTASVKILH